jgi:dipeptidyl aminopeptidase/acylaminoacyl peptidase
VHLARVWLTLLALLAPAACAVQASETAGTATEPAHLVSMPALIGHEYDGRALRLDRVLDRTDAYTRHLVTYRSGSLTISGVMNLPHGDGPFPVIVLAHGYIDPADYETGDGFEREQDHLARRGFVVMHTDYRGHAGSDVDLRTDPRRRLGYPEDLVNAVRAVKRLPVVDPDRVGILGRSMGGGVTLQALAATPGLVDAAVVYSAVSSDATDNYDRWIRDRPVEEEVVRRFGSPESAPRFWREAGARDYLHRISEPVLLQHGSSDDTCPAQWSRATYDTLRRLGKDATLVLHNGEEHRFTEAWAASMRQTVNFFDEHLSVERSR